MEVSEADKALHRQAEKELKEVRVLDRISSGCCVLTLSYCRPRRSSLLRSRCVLCSLSDQQNTLTDSLMLGRRFCS